MNTNHPPSSVLPEGAKRHTCSGGKCGRGISGTAAAVPAPGAQPGGTGGVGVLAVLPARAREAIRYVGVAGGGGVVAGRAGEGVGGPLGAVRPRRAQHGGRANVPTGAVEASRALGEAGGREPDALRGAVSAGGADLLTGDRLTP